MIFIDTGAWIALEDVNDNNHVMAVKSREELKKEKESFITTSYVSDETVTAQYPVDL